MSHDDNWNDVLSEINDKIADVSLAEALEKIEELLAEIQVIRDGLKVDLRRQ